VYLGIFNRGRSFDQAQFGATQLVIELTAPRLFFHGYRHSGRSSAHRSGQRRNDRFKFLIRPAAQRFEIHTRRNNPRRMPHNPEKSLVLLNQKPSNAVLRSPARRQGSAPPAAL
jgi:hypothetical protein